MKRLCRSVVALAVVSLGALPARAEESSLWFSFQGRSESIKQSGKVRPEYVDGILRDCLNLGEARKADSNVAPARVQAAREVCLLTTREFIKRCVEAAATDCKPLDASKLAENISALGPLSPEESALLARIPDPYWAKIRQQLASGVRAPGVNAARDLCAEAAKKATPQTAANLREAGRDLCVAAAQTFSRTCLAKGESDPSCMGPWDGWESTRDAARSLAPLTAEQSALFEQILTSPALVEVNAARQFKAILEERADKKLDRCAAIARMRDVLGSPTEDVIKRVEDARKNKAVKGTLDRLSTYLYLVDETYRKGTDTLARPVEQQTVPMAEEAITALRCVPDYKDAKSLVSKAEANLTSVRDYEAKEAACLAEPACKATRVASEICLAIEARKDTDKAIAEEHRYARKAGVISLTKLGELKSALQILDDEIAQKKEAYRGLVKRAFAPAACPKQKK